MLWSEMIIVKSFGAPDLLAIAKGVNIPSDGSSIQVSYMITYRNDIDVFMCLLMF